MTNQNSRKQHCPDKLHLELLCLDNGLDKELRKRSQIHLQQCSKCRERLKELDEIYKTITREIRKPVSNKLLDFVKGKSSSKVKYGLLDFAPSPKKNSDRGKAFKTKLLFSANGDHGKKMLADFDMSIFDKRHLAVRVMTDPACKKVLAFLHSDREANFSSYVMELPGAAENINFNTSGVAVIPVNTLEKLDDKLVYLNSETYPSSVTGKDRFQRIKDAIF
jgi:hypothetical protein